MMTVWYLNKGTMWWTYPSPPIARYRYLYYCLMTVWYTVDCTVPVVMSVLAPNIIARCFQKVLSWSSLLSKLFWEGHSKWVHMMTECPSEVIPARCMGNKNQFNNFLPKVTIFENLAYLEPTQHTFQWPWWEHFKLLYTVKTLQTLQYHFSLNLYHIRTVPY